MTEYFTFAPFEVECNLYMTLEQGRGEKEHVAMKGPEEILTFWLDEVGEKRWYAQDEALDARVRDQFEETWEAAMEGRFGLWLTYPSGALAYIVLLDQFTRNVFRGSGDAFQHDSLARELALDLIDSGRKDELYPIEQGLVFMPLEHSEELALQERCVELFEALTDEVPESITDTFANFTQYAIKHRDIIARFGRFPHRNALLGRESTPEEVAYLNDGGETFGQKKS